MAKLKVAQVIRCLQTKERNRWFRELEAEKGDARPELVAAARYLVQVAPDDDSPNREHLFVSAFPGEPYDDLKLRHLTADLLRSAEQFLLREELQDQPVLEELFLLRAFRKRGLDSFFEAGQKKLEAQLEKHPFRNIDYHYYRFLFDAEKTRFLEGQKIRTVEPNLQATTNSLDAFYLAGKMYYGCSQVNHSGVVTTAYRFDLMEESVAFIRKQQMAAVPAIGLYYHVWCMLNGEEDQLHFQLFRERIAQESGLFPPEEARDLYVHAVNYCIKRMRDGGEAFLREAFELYREMLERKVFFEDGHMSPWMYKNVTVAGLRLGESVWVEKFVEDYKDYLSPKFQETAYTYNSAQVAFARGKFDKVLSLLQEVEYQEIFYALDSKAILLKTYFELKEDEALDSLCASFRVFLNRRREISEGHRNSYLDLIRVVKAAVRVRQNRDTGLLARIKKELAENQSFLDRRWLETKLGELEAYLRQKRAR
ncbi:MAG: hypothetical protein GC205_11895 [Bacteroidetes bacterium]|nr:hypothetical protein [Bacteroidota bacterium]